MAVSLPLYINQATYDAEAERRGQQGTFYQSAAGTVRSGALGPAPTVTVSGVNLLVGPFSAVIGSGKGAYQLSVDSVTTASGTITTADATNARRDRLVLEVLDPDNGITGGTRVGRLRIITGTAAAVPALPALPALALHIAAVDVPKSGSGAPSVTIDTPLTATVGAPVPVRNVTERGQLTPRVGDQVNRLDVPGVIQTWTGSTWDDSIVPAVGSSWALSGLLVKHRTGLGTQVTAGFMCTYPAAAGPFAINGAFKQAMTLNVPGFTPLGDVFGSLLILSNGNVERADGTFNINSQGQIWIRTTGASYSIQPGDKFYISANWSA